MLSVLIADDEWIEREGISMLLNQSACEFRILMAENGEEALKCLAENDVDILFTDIKMPFMDGLELLVQANQYYRKLKIVIFSAFADFHYAKTALENRVLHYFLKPVDPDEFRTVLEEIVAAVLKEQEESRIAWDRSGSWDEAGNYLYKGGPAPAGLADLLKGTEGCLLQLYDLQEESEQTNAVFYDGVLDWFEDCLECMTVSEGIYLLLFGTDAACEAKVLSCLEACGAQEACVIVDEQKRGIDAIPAAFRQMEEMLRFHFFSDGNQLLHAGEGCGSCGNSEQVMERIMKEIYHGIDHENLQYVKENLILLRDELRSHVRDSQIYVKYMYANILKQMLHDREVPQTVFKGVLDRLFAENTLTAIHNLLMQLAEQWMASAAEGREGSEHKRVIRTILDLIDTHYQEDISLQSAADAVYLSPSYLSYLFKREVGVSLVKYITMVRLNKAKELLLSGNMKISDIAAMVGYQNYSYFNITFRNNVGESPAQYRERRS